MSKSLRTPDLAELRALCAAVDLGSLERAARLLRIDEPSVAALLDGLAGEGAPVRLAASPTIAEVVLPPIMVELESRRERHLSLELSIANSLTVRELVREGRVDVGIGAASEAGAADAGLWEAPFCEDEIVVAVPERHPWARLEAIDPAEFVAAAMIMRDPGADSRRAVSERVEALGMSLAPPLAEIGSTAAALTTAAARGAPALLSSLAFVPAGKPGLVVRRVAGLSFRRRFAVFHGGEESLSPPARSLLDDLLAASPP